jgi:hypothetical protein
MPTPHSVTLSAPVRQCQPVHSLPLLLLLLLRSVAWSHVHLWLPVVI